MRWIGPDRYHVTLKFLGQVRQDRIPLIETAMEKVASSTVVFSSALGGFGAFPTIRRPQVIWLGVEATPELRCLKQDLEWALGDCGFDAETRAFHPHVTLGRADDSGGAGAFRGLDEVVAGMTFAGEIKVRSIDLMKSTFTPSGAKYSVVSSAKLAKG